MKLKSDSKGNNVLSRRDFVKSSSAVVGSLMASQFPLSASAYFSSDETIKVGLIGCGGRGTGAALQALSTKTNVKLVAMADAFRDRLRESTGIDDSALRDTGGGL